jgi:hypothetical protein
MNFLVKKIETAFVDVLYPGDDCLTDSFGEEAEALEVEFRGKTNWKELEPGFLNQAANIYGSLEISDSSYRLCVFVTPQMEKKKIAKFYGGGTLGEHTRKQFSRFSALQVSAIVSYLWWKLEKEGYNPTIEQALENYWLEREI